MDDVAANFGAAVAIVSLFVRSGFCDFLIAMTFDIAG
jgi:hypothetical protein